MTEENEIYKGPERRNGYCPVHHIKCQQIEMVEADSKKKVPIWVFVLAMGVISAVLGYQMRTTANEITKSNKEIVNHVELSWIAVRTMNSGIREIGLNQKRVLQKLNLDYEYLKEYEKDLDYGNRGE